MKREYMVKTQLVRRGLEDPKVLQAMRKVPRHRFVLPDDVDQAYGDHPLPIKGRQTISQPYIVAAMTEAGKLKASDKVLEIGTGSGYQAAILAEIVEQVFTIEIVPVLAKDAEAVLDELGYRNVTVKAGDGYQGWTEFAPFDAIIVTAAPDHVPQPLIDQLKVGGRMVIPVGRVHKTQQLRLLTKQEDGSVTDETLMAVRFVPFTRGE